MRANGWTPADAPQPTQVEFRQAVCQREQFTRTWEQFVTQWDVLLCPASPTTATRHDQAEPIIDGQKVPADEDYWVTGSISPLTGLTSVVIPAGLDSQGLPIGVQLIGRRWEDERLLPIAVRVAAITGGFRRPPGY
jgi:amidase